LFVITPDQVEDFVSGLPVSKLHGVGKVTADKLGRLGIVDCSHLREWGKLALVREFGSFGERLWSLARGIDDRQVHNDSRRQSISVENTYDVDLPDLVSCLDKLPELLETLAGRMARIDSSYRPGKPFVKVKFHDFTQTTLEQAGAGRDLGSYQLLLTQAFNRGGKPVRLLGIGVRLAGLSRWSCLSGSFAVNVRASSRASLAPTGIASCRGEAFAFNSVQDPPPVARHPWSMT
jgi:DNA polymerase-4